MKQEKAKRYAQAHDPGSAAAHAEHPDLQDPNVVLSLLEADQVVAAKTRTRFGKRKLSVGARLLLWGLRVYVFVMLVIVLISVIRALHGGQ
ncbi:MAG TPA: hypothetical protein VN785_01510 [Candidatus Angelobacter sp.]|nr:hypothetical protein [Candidatus Angelobacter sp.]